MNMLRFRKMNKSPVSTSIAPRTPPALPENSASSTKVSASSPESVSEVSSYG